MLGILTECSKARGVVKARVVGGQMRARAGGIRFGRPPCVTQPPGEGASGASGGTRGAPSGSFQWGQCSHGVQDRG